MLDLINGESKGRLTTRNLLVLLQPKEKYETKNILCLLGRDDIALYLSPFSLQR